MRPQGFICGMARRGKNGDDKRDIEMWKDTWDYEVLTTRAKIDEDRPSRSWCEDLCKKSKKSVQENLDYLLSHPMLLIISEKNLFIIDYRFYVIDDCIYKSRK